FNLIPSDVGRSLMDITHRLDYPQLMEDAQSTFETLRLTERAVTGGGRHFMTHMLPYRTAEDRIEGAVLSFIDITALRESQQETRDATNKLRIAAESTQDFAITTTDGAGRVTSWNRGAARLFGYSEAEMLGHDLAETFSEADRSAGIPEQLMAHAREHGRAEDERWHRRKDGSTFFSSGVTTRLDGDQGFSKIARDLTHSQETALAREHLLSEEQAGRRQAEAAVEAKELFLAVMSHELKHPLNLIHMNAELLARMPEIRHVASAMRAAGIIQKTVAGQARIVDDLLDLARARTGKLRLEPELVDWGEIAQRIADSMREEAEAHGVRLRLDVSEPAPMSMFDAVRANQVVWNLLNNAIKFTPADGTVQVDVGVDGEFARVMVTDTGRGIAPEFLDGVFDMFSQEDDSRRSPDDGLGIGLALVSELIQAQGGRVQVRSDGLGRGTEFTIWMPLHHGTPPAAAVVPQEPVATSVLKGRRLLLVDDSEDSVESFAMLLRLTEAEVDTAVGGQAALACLQQGRYDLLLSDISMPMMNGYELIRAVRALADGGTLMAIACSGYSRAQDEKQAIDAGFDALIPKPASLERVESTVAALVQGRQAAAAR
ncbi:MAG: ATP-binding protein, partial [Burkholderiaceae bacterium]